MLSAEEVAEYFLSSGDEEGRDLISNMKLQKLVYYAQGVHLALYGEPLFSDEIKAWIHGPVVPSLYHLYKEYGDGPIPPPVDLDYSRYSEREREVLDEVYNVFGQFSAWKLRCMTHEEPPWKDTPTNEVITHQAMKRYFDTIVEK